MDTVVNEVYDLVMKNAEQIAEKILNPRGYWFYFQKDNVHGIAWSAMLTASTKLNPANFKPGEWIFKIDCNDDLDDVPPGEEIEAYCDSILNDWTPKVIQNMITFPAGE